MDTSQQKMVRGPTKPPLRNKKSAQEQEEEEIGLLAETLRILDSISEMRFIQKISRPIQRRVKEEYVEKMAGKMESLHVKLQKIRVEVGQKTNTENGNTKPKSVMGSVTHKPIDWKKSIRTIQNRYTEVFYEGSFKHYGKLYSLNRFSYPLKTINVEEWSRACLHKESSSNSCC